MDNNEQLQPSLSEAEILRLHQEQDPASPLFKGSVPAPAGIPGTTAEGTQPDSAYYEPTGDKVDPIADAIPEPQGTTPFTTEEVTIPHEAPVAEPEVEPVGGINIGTDEETHITPPESSELASEETPTAPPEDADITGA